MNQEDYLRERVENQLQFYAREAKRAKGCFIWMQSSIIVLGLLVPVLVNIPQDWLPPFGQYGMRGLITLLSFSLAAMTGILNFRKYGDLWLSYRLTEEGIKNEKYLFLTRSGDYRQEDSAFPRFVARVESIISTEHNKFRTLIEEVRRPAKQEKSTTE